MIHRSPQGVTWSAWFHLCSFLTLVNAKAFVSWSWRRKSLVIAGRSTRGHIRIFIRCVFVLSCFWEVCVGVCGCVSVYMRRCVWLFIPLGGDQHLDKPRHKYSLLFEHKNNVRVSISFMDLLYRIWDLYIGPLLFLLHFLYYFSIPVTDASVIT